LLWSRGIVQHKASLLLLRINDPLLLKTQSMKQNQVFCLCINCCCTFSGTKNSSIRFANLPYDLPIFHTICQIFQKCMGIFLSNAYKSLLKGINNLVCQRVRPKESYLKSLVKIKSNPWIRTLYKYFSQPTEFLWNKWQSGTKQWGRNSDPKRKIRAARIGYIQSAFHSSIPFLFQSALVSFIFLLVHFNVESSEFV
jgi:hypothetical protein